VRLENSFEVPTTLEETWNLLNDVPRVVPCMPGAELTETVGANNWKARVHVRLGPIALQFDTDVVRELEDEGAHRVVLVTKAREARGRGAAQATIESNLSEFGGTTSVQIVTDLKLQGAVAQYGRGIVPDVASQLTREFAGNLAALLAGGDAQSITDNADGVPTPVVAVSGFRLGLRALWMALARAVRRT
jgi:uncharacterized protein